MTKKIIIFILIIIVFTALVYNFSFRSKNEYMTFELANNSNVSIDKNTSTVNNSMNEMDTSKENIILISLEKPPDKVIGG